MSLFIGARVGIGRQHCSHEQLLCDIAGMQPTYLFAFSYLWSELHAAFNRELEAITISQASDMLQSKTPAIFVGASANKSAEMQPSPLSDFQVALHERNVLPRLALSVIARDVSLDVIAAAPEAARALQQLQLSKQTFVKHAAAIIGSCELLLANWFQRMGGRVVAAVTGGGHTSDEVLAWMQVRCASCTRLKHCSTMSHDVTCHTLSHVTHAFAVRVRLQNHRVQGAGAHLEKLLRLLRIPRHQLERRGV